MENDRLKSTMVFLLNIAIINNKCHHTLVTPEGAKKISNYMYAHKFSLLKEAFTNLIS